ncbi:hypothetical protein AB0C60_34330, partial [Streptomyces sp. NPDC048845]
MAATTHTVTNQAPPLVGYDVFAADAALAEGVARHAPADLLNELRAELGELGRAAGSAQAQEWGHSRSAAAARSTRSPWHGGTAPVSCSPPPARS